jgi:hypothetical protein
MASNLALKEEMTEGLGSFALGEADAEAYLAEEVDSGGIADLGAIRERMAKAGRFDDDHVGHLATGELVVPAPLLEKLPELRESILGHLREMGVEDPERYIVGNELNSVNPETGMVEFGFFSSISKAFKSIGKVLKKVAPLIITAAVAAIPGVGPIAAGMIGSGLGTLVQGGSFKDAIISAGIGGITAGIAPSVGDIGAQALGGMAQAAVAGGDMKDILTGGAIGAAGAGLGKFAKANFPETIGSITGETLDPNASTLSYISEDLGKAGNFASSIVGGNVSEAFKPSADAFSSEFDSYFGTSPAATTAAVTPASNAPLTIGKGPGAGQYLQNRFRTGTALGSDFEGIDFGGTYSPAPAAGQPLTADPGYGSPAPESSTWVGRRMEGNFPETMEAYSKDPAGAVYDQFLGGKNDLSTTDSAQIQTDEYNKTFSAYTAKGAPPELAKAAANTAAANALEKATPGFFGKNPWALTVPAVGALAFSDTLFGEEIPGEGDPNVLPGDFSPGGPSQEAIAANRLASISGNPDALKPLTFANRQTRVNPAINEDLRRRFPEMFAEAGGEVFPRRTGGIMPDEGVPGKDSVRALVMPGEFIFTKNAVHGASPDGSLEGGINNMYSVMRNLETRGRRMA